jgi:hypothetical protein
MFSPYIDNETELTDYKVDIRQLGITNYKLKSRDEQIDEGKYSKFELIENVAVHLILKSRKNCRIKSNHYL